MMLLQCVGHVLAARTMHPGRIARTHLSEVNVDGLRRSNGVACHAVDIIPETLGAQPLQIQQQHFNQHLIKIIPIQ